MIATITLQKFADYHARRTPVTCGDTILQSGEYFLKEDCVANTLNAIEIEPNHVDLDLNGYAIRCSSALKYTSGIKMTHQQNTIIRNGKIQNCTYAIHGIDVVNINITGVTFKDNEIVDIVLGGHGNRIVQNIFQNSGTYGIHSPGKNCIIANNKFRDIKEGVVKIFKKTIDSNCLLERNE